MKRDSSATTNPDGLAGPARYACQGSYRLFGLAGSSRFCGIIRHFGESVLIRMRKLLGNAPCRRHNTSSTMMLRFGVTMSRFAAVALERESDDDLQARI